MDDDDDEPWLWFKRQPTIPNIDRMPIPHMARRGERKILDRTTTGSGRVRRSRGQYSRDSLDFGQGRSRNNSDVFLDIDNTPPDTDSEQEDSGSESGKVEPTISEKIYVNACAQCRVVPGKRILRSLKSAKVSAKDRDLLSKDVEPIAYALTTNDCVETLDMSGNSIGKEGLVNILRMLEENHSITCLNISDNKLGAEGAIIVGTMLTQNVNLKTLNASGNDFSDEDASHIATGISQARTLTSLDLSHNRFAEEGGREIADSIEQNDSLVDLNLGWNNLRLSGGAAIGSSLLINSTIRSLNLSWNGLANDGCKAIGTSLETNTTLDTLDLCNNRVGYEGAKFLAKGLKVNTSLKTLKLSRNSLSSMGAVELLSAVRDNPDSKLTVMELKEVPVADSTFTVLEEIRNNRPDLDVIHDIKVLSEDFLAATADTRKNISRTVIVNAKGKKGKKGKKKGKKKK